MKRSLFFKRLSVFFPVVGFAILPVCGGEVMPTRDELAFLHPAIINESVAENEKIICPFLRMIEKTGLFDGQVDPVTSTVANQYLVAQAKTFGCSEPLCTSFANGVSKAQSNPSGVNIEALHTAKSIAHECGFHFEKGASVISEEVRQNTLVKLTALADEEGNVTYANIKAVKLDICKEQGVDLTFIGEGEAKLIFTYLGGLDNGKVAVNDIDLFLNAQLPKTITLDWLKPSLIDDVK